MQLPPTEKGFRRFYSADPGHLFKAGSLPSMPDDKGHLVFFDSEPTRLMNCFIMIKCIMLFFIS